MDVNCNWSEVQCQQAIPELLDLNVRWLDRGSEDPENQWRATRTSFTPHSPHFGPGFLATLQLAGAEESTRFVEYLYVQPECWIYLDMPLPEDGMVCIPDGKGLGMDPDPRVLERYYVNG